MLPKNNRLRRHVLKELQKGGKTLHTTNFSIRRVSSEGVSAASVVVSKKVVPKAAARNLLRRRVYAVLQNALPLVAEHTKIIVYTKRGAAMLSYKEMEEELVRALVEIVVR
jgi:ribonuclease P protein component